MFQSNGSWNLTYTAITIRTIRAFTTPTTEPNEETRNEQYENKGFALFDVPLFLRDSPGF